MSVDQVTEEIRDQLLDGARRRLRHERRRAWIAGVVAVVAVIAVVGVVVVRSQESTRVTTVASTGDQAAFAVCDEFLSIIARSDFNRNDWDTFARNAAATDDAELATLAAALRDRGWTPANMVADDYVAIRQVRTHCTDIGSPSFNARYVPIELGPQPAVDLRTYGETQLFEFDEQPAQGPPPPVGRGLSPVQLAVTSKGGYVLYWTAAGEPSGTSSCLAYGATAVIHLESCVGTGDARGAEVSRPFATADHISTLHVPAGTSFVVMESAGERYVQRPAAQTVVIVWKTPRNQTPVTAREYDVNGNELRCHGAC